MLRLRPVSHPADRPRMGTGFQRRRRGGATRRRSGRWCEYEGIETPADISTQQDRPRSARPHRGAEVELAIDSLAHGGRGVARIDGYVVFVNGGLPGDRVRARITKSKRGYGEATVIEMIEPSPDRIPDTCVHDGEPCPGAAWQGLPYETQLVHKAGQVEDALRRLGGLDGFTLEPIEPAVAQWRYRNKLEYSFGENPETGELQLGFHRRGSWSEIVNVTDCHLASEANNEARNRVREWAAGEGLNAYDTDSRTGALRNLIVRDSVRTEQVQTRLVTAAASFNKPPVDLHTIVEGDSGSTAPDAGPTGVLGEEHLFERLCGLNFRISPGAFFQTNTEMAERLYEIVAEFAALEGHERVFDLYCGIGTIGLTLARQAKEIWGLEIVESAVVDAEENARINGIHNAKFVAVDARLGITPLLERAGQPDLVIVDPPRAGLSKKVVRRLIEVDSPRIVYVSCNPTTLAPNVAQLVEDGGYKLVRVKPVDMFPQTPHVEAVALLERA